MDMIHNRKCTKHSNTTIVAGGNKTVRPFLAAYETSSTKLRTTANLAWAYKMLAITEFNVALQLLFDIILA